MFNRPQKPTTRISFLVLASIGLLTLFLWPSLVAAVPLTTKHQFDRVWKLARDIGRYDFAAQVLQTNHPTPRIENIGRGPETIQVSASGQVNVPEDALELQLVTNGRPIEVRIEDGVAKGRAGGNEEWVEIDNPGLLFAPGNDVTGFAAAAENIQIVDNWQADLDVVTAVQVAKATTLFTFDLNGPRFAEHMRRQTQAELARKGELPPGVDLGLAQQFVDMTGQGKLWVDAAGLPVHQVIHIEFLAEKGAMSQVDADIITNFFGWDANFINHRLFWLLPRLFENPSLLRDDPLSLLPNLSALKPAAIERAGITLGMLMLLAALGIFVVIHRRSRKLYATVAVSICVALVVTPLLQTNRLYAFSLRTEQQAAARAAEQNAQQASNLLTADMATEHFNPQQNPLESVALAPDQRVASASTFSPSESTQALPALQSTCVLTDTNADCDGDGLSNGVEMYRLGTDPQDIDTDGDFISDRTEVAGFNNGQEWHLNPLNPDSNDDHLLDSNECAALIDVNADGAFSGVDVSNNVCADSDGDNTPDVFDFDNDGDGVPDSVDTSPYYTDDLTTADQDSLNLSLSGYTTDATLVVEYQIRPDNPDHLWQTNQAFDWPQDTEGQVRMVNDHKLNLSPVLEITIPAPTSNSANIVGSLPITAGKTIADVSTGNTLDQWLDTDMLDKYGIKVVQSAAGEELKAYVPLIVVKDSVGDMPVAWSGHMVYRPDVANWGQAHQVRLVWFVTGKSDTCDVTNMPAEITYNNRQGKTVTLTDDTDRYNYWCSQPQNFVQAGDGSVFHVYDDKFTVTGMSVTEYTGVKTAVVAQTNALNVPYEDNLWRLASGLNRSFLQGKLFGANQARFDIAEVKHRFDNDGAAPYSNGAAELWGIANGQLAVSLNTGLPDQVTGLETLMQSQIPQILADTYGGSANLDTGDQVTLLTLREESSRSANLGDSTAFTTSSSNGVGHVAIDLSGQVSTVVGATKWNPYQYNGVEWQPTDPTSYLVDDLQPQLDGILQDIDVTSLADGGEVISDLAAARAGVVGLALDYYIGMLQGPSTFVEYNNGAVVDTSSSTLDDYLVNDAAITLDGSRPAFVSIADQMLTLVTGLLAAKSTITVDGDVIASTTLGSLDKIEIAEGVGESEQALRIDASDPAIQAFRRFYFIGRLMKAVIKEQVLKVSSGTRRFNQRLGSELASIAGLLSGAIRILAPQLGLTERQAVIISMSIDVPLVALGTFGAGALFYQGWNLKSAAKLSEEQGNAFDKLTSSTRAGAVIGLAVDIAIVAGIAIYTIVANHIEPGSLEFNDLVLQTTLQVALKIILTALSFVFPVGTVIVSILSLLDVIALGVCAVIDAIGGKDATSPAVDKWVCGGLSGAIVAGAAHLIHDVWLTVDLNQADRVQMAMYDPQVNAEAGFVTGATVDVRMDITNTLTLNRPKKGGPVDNTYTTAKLKEKMRRSAFGYSLQQSPTDHHDELDFGSVNWGSDNREVFHPSLTLTYTDAGPNQSKDLYLTESYNIVNLECWGFIFTSKLSCKERPVRGSTHTKLSAIVFDIFPATFDEFVQFGDHWAGVSNLSWLHSVYQNDIDNDGLSGYSDPDRLNPDADGDGLSDLWEKNNETNPRVADSDGDGLSDYWEIFYGANPRLKDSDGDGLLDGAEFFHSQSMHAIAADTQPWTGGWNMVYDYDADDNALTTIISADPLEADADFDSLLDPTERTYGYNPNIISVLNPLSIDSAIQTASAQAGIVGVGDPINYTATVGNEDAFNAVTGNLQVEIPVDSVQASDAIDNLLPGASAMFSGVAAVGAVNATAVTSVTLRAAGLLHTGGVLPSESITDNALINMHFDEDSLPQTLGADGQYYGSYSNSGVLGGAAECQLTHSRPERTAAHWGCPIPGGKGKMREGAIFSGVPQKITYPYNAALDLDTFSMGLWIKPQSFGNRGERDLINKEYYLRIRADHRIDFGIRDSSCTSTRILDTVSSVVPEQWNHVMATYDGATMKVYVNGVLDSRTASYTGGVCHTGDTPFAIDNNTRLDSVVDEVLLFGSALSAADVQTIYNYQIAWFDVTQQHPILIDAAAPVSTLTLGVDLPNRPVMLGITTIDDASRVVAVKVTVTSPNSGATVLDASQDESGSGLWYFMFTPDGEGQYTIAMEGTDAVGNVGTDTTSIYVDDSPPSADVDSALTSTIFTTNQANQMDDNMLSLAGGINDNRGLAGTVAIDVQDWLNTSVHAPQVVTIVTDTVKSGRWGVDYLFPEPAYGEYAVVADMADLVGNTITKSIGTLAIDDIGPWADVTMAEPSLSGPGTVHGTVSDLRYNAIDRAFHFHFEEATGATDFVDATFEKFVATCNGAACPTAGQSGRYGNGIALDGGDTLTIAANDYLTMTNGTLSAWVYPTWSAGSNGYNPTLLAADDGSKTGFRWQIADDYSAMLLTTDSGAQSAPVTINPNEWSHLALVMADGQWTAYVNGIPTASVPQAFGDQTGLPIHIGSANGSSGFFTGRLDEIIVYKSARTADDIYDIANPLATTVSSLEIQARYLNGAIWPGVDPDGLKMYLPLDDLLGATDFQHTSLITQSVSCDDESGSCPTAGVDGAFGGAVQFDGNDYIEIPATSDLDFHDMSVSFWVKVGPDSFNDDLIGKGRLGWSIYMHPTSGDGRIVFDTPQLKDANSANSSILIADRRVTDNQWRHVVAIVDGDQKRIYVDGTLAGAQTTTGSLQNTHDPLTIGANYEDAGISVTDGLHGALDEVVFFDRALTADEIQILYQWQTWQPVTLDSPNSFYSTWTTNLPADLEGLYTIGLRATDSVGNVKTNPHAWAGPVDLQAPRLDFTYRALDQDFVQVHCAATDLNITAAGWVCPSGAPIAETRQSADWYVDYFSPVTRTVGLASSVQTIETTADGVFTACDLHGNCRTETVAKSAAPEGVAILEPINGTVLHNYEPVTIRGLAWSDKEIRHVSVLVDGNTLQSFQWSYSQGATRGTWSATWTPTPGKPVFELEALLLTGEYTGGGFDPGVPGLLFDESETFVHAPSLYLSKSVSPEFIFSGNPITYTIVVANNGLQNLTGVAISDSLPAGVAATTSATGISATVDLAIGEAVTYTIPAIVTAAQGEITNTVKVEHVTFSDQDSAVLSICGETMLVENSNRSGAGSFPYALANVCAGGKVLFANDVTVPFDTYTIDKAVTIDGAGYAALLDGVGLIITDGTGPVALQKLTIRNAGFESESALLVGESAALTLVDVMLYNNSSYLGSPYVNRGEMTIVNSSVEGYSNSGVMLRNETTGQLTFQNSTVLPSITNAAGGVIIVDYSTVVASIDSLATPAIENDGAIRMNSSIFVLPSGTDCSGTGAFIDLGYNLVAAGGTCPSDSGTTLTVDPNLIFTTVLTPLTNSDGYSEMYALPTGSPALDVIPNGVNGCGTDIATDQRGVARPQNGACDIGAYEAEPIVSNVAPVLDAIPAQSVVLGATVTFTATASDANGDSLTFSLSDAPATATIDSASGLFTWTPAATGLYTTVVIVSDGALTDSQIVDITVIQGNVAPVAADDSYSMAQDTVLNVPAPGVLGNDTDADGNALTAVLNTIPANGALTLNGDGSFNYLPNGGYAGSDSFTYHVNDGAADSNVATVTIMVSSPSLRIATQDSFMRSGNNNTNEGANLNLVIRADGNNRALVTFDLAGLSAPVGQASLRLYIVYNADNWGNEGRTIDAHRLTEAWIEGNGANLQPGNLTNAEFNPYENRGDGPGVTWQCAMDAEVHNQSSDCNPKWSGGAYIDAPTASVTIYKDFDGNSTLPPTTTTMGWISFDVTADVNTCLANSQPQCGWLIKKSQEGQPGRVEFASKEGAAALYNNLFGEPVAPQLVISAGANAANTSAVTNSSQGQSNIFLPLVSN